MIPATMKGLLLRQDGYADDPGADTPDDLSSSLDFGTVAVPRPGSREVLVRVLRASVNPADMLFVKGQYGYPRRKGQPAGFEGAGIVVGAGDDPAAQALVGRRVAFQTGNSIWGAWAEYAIASVSACYALIDGVSDADAAGCISNPMTALALFDIVKRHSGPVILTAAGSQVSRLLLRLLTESDVSAIAIVRRADQAKRVCEQGASVALDSSTADFPERLATAIETEKPRLLLDAVAGCLGARIFRAMPPGSRWVLYGMLDRKAAPMPEPAQFIAGGKSIDGFWLTKWLREAGTAGRLAAAAEVQSRFAEGRWSTRVAATLSLEEAIGRLPIVMANPDGKILIAPR